MKVVDDLLAAISADPSDEAPQLVIADLLIAEGDPRGELIVLDRRERAGQLDDRAALERLLLLSAEYSFPCARASEPALPFDLRSDDPLTYEVDHGDHHYTLSYQNHLLEVVRTSLVRVWPPVGHDDADYEWPTHGVPEEHDYRLALADPGRWRPDEAHAILAVLGDVLRAGSPLEDVRFPYSDLTLPTYDGGPLRCYALPLEFTIPRGLQPDRYGLAARDHRRWHQLWRRLREVEGHIHVILK